MFYFPNGKLKEIPSFIFCKLCVHWEIDVKVQVTAVLYSIAEPCPAGFYCPPGGRGRIPCPQGTYQPNISQTSEQACKSCPFFTNSSKNPSGIRPNVYEADCPGEDPSITSKGTAWMCKSKLERAFCPTCFCESVSRNGLQLSSSTIQIKKMKL